jgi:hypothetical protein
VLFLEQNVDAPLGNRIDRWWEARNGETCGVPWVIVDSGFRVTCGAEDFASVYHKLVDAALANPPAAAVSATYRRADPALDVTVEVTNHSPVALGNRNWATVNVLVFERAHVVHTDRFVRAVGQTALLTDLAPGRKGLYNVHLDSVPVTDWARATVVVLVDYQPASGPFLALQAAVAGAWAGSLDAAHLLLPLAIQPVRRN